MSMPIPAARPLSAATFALALALGVGCGRAEPPAPSPDAPASMPSETPASAADPAAVAPPAASLAATTSPAQPARTGAFAVWESNRSGAYRIWRQDLATGSAPRQISQEEPGRDHCCAKISPDGRRLVYLSLPGGSRGYRADAGALHLADADGGRDRVLVAEARHNGEHRAAIWWGIDELLHLDGEGKSVLRRLSTGSARTLASPAASGEGWLIEPGGRWASGNTPTFSEVRDGKVVERASVGGCQPAFTADGLRAVWSAGAGGPIDAIDLATRRTWTLISKNDPRLPEGRRYVYFPMLSADSTLLALAGSNGEHDHFRADYDVLILELDPQTLRPRGDASVVAPNPAVDRFPDVFRSAAPPASGAPIAAAPGAAPVSARETERAQGLVLAWDRGDAGAPAGPLPPPVLRAHDLAWLDRSGGMALGGGSYTADDEVGAALSAALRGSNQFSLAFRAAPATLAQDAPLVALSGGGARRGLVLRQRGDRLELLLRTSDTPKEGRAVELAKLPSAAPVHVVVTFSPGRLTTYLDGAAAGATQPFAGDFFAWKSMPLAFGSAPGESARWRGALGHLAVWTRELDAREAESEAARSRALAAKGPATPRVEVEARVVRTSPAPDLASISPYREALAADEIEIVRQISGEPMPKRLRRVRWTILDGRTLPAPVAGAVERLTLEPFGSQPQLQSFYLSDALGDGVGPLWFDLAATAGR